MTKTTTHQTSPDVISLEFNDSISKLLSVMMAQLTEYDPKQKTYVLSPQVARPFCLSVAKGDSQKAGELFTRMESALSEWAHLYKSGNAKAMPIP